MPERYRYEKTTIDKTGFAVMSCIDTQTGLVVRTPLASDERSFAGFVAYVGAKFSRSREGLIVLMSEVEAAFREGKLEPEKRVANIVHGLKHQSPGGMAHVVVTMENMPIITAANVFRTTVLHDGQESSTRYIDFESGNDLPELKTLLPEGIELPEELNDQYRGLQKVALTNYLSWFKPVYEAYKDHFQIDENDKNQKDALTARTYDTIRGFLLSGFKTSVVYVTNATTMQQLLSNLSANRLPGEGQLAAGLLALLRPEEQIKGYVPEIKPLLNHTEANLRNREEQKALKEFFEKQPGYQELLKKRRQFGGLRDNVCTLIPKDVGAPEQIIAQHLLVIHPSLKFEDALKFAGSLNDKQKAEIGNIIFANRDRFYLPSISTSAGTIDAHMSIDLGIERDLGRHRAWERVSPIQETHVGIGEVSETGFTQAAYLREIDKFGDIQRGMESDMVGFYNLRATFLENLAKVAGSEAADKVGMYLLPLAHHVDMIMNGDPRNLVHLEDIRIRPGAHIDARRMVQQLNQQVADRDPLYSSLRYPNDMVLVDDREQFVRRD